MRKPKKIVITGPESTGKTVLCRQLAAHFSAPFVPEYAREYVVSLGRRYTYTDIEYIARKQTEIEKEFSLNARNYLFFDTYLIITKIWFQWCYNKYPKWIDTWLQASDVDLFLLCNTDIPWESDEVRENGGENRNTLFNLYLNEIKKYNFRYSIISETGTKRIENAIKAIENIN